MKLAVGVKFDDLKLPDIGGGVFDVNEIVGKKTLITFYRFAQCPFCNLRINEFKNRFNEFDYKLNVVAVFDSPLGHLKKSMKKHNAPFRILADENFFYFRKYNVEQSVWKFFVGTSLRFHRLIEASLKGYIPITFKGSVSTIPVDILLDENGIIENVYYGNDTTDHLSFETILDFAKSS